MTLTIFASAVYGVSVVVTIMHDNPVSSMITPITMMSEQIICSFIYDSFLVVV